MIVTVNTKIEYQGKIYDLISADFDENLVCIIFFPDEKKKINKYKWIRYENCKLVNE